MSSKLRSADFAVLDMFGVKPTINFKGKDKSYSVFGITLTLLLVGFIVWQLVVLSKDLFDRTNPTFTQYKLDGGAKGEGLEMSHEIFDLTFRLRDENYVSYVDRRYYMPWVYVQRPDGQTTLELEVCKSKLSPTTDAWCFKDFDKTILKGDEDHIFVSIAPCQSGNGVVCASNADITAKLANNFVVMEYLDSAANPENFETPITSYYRPDYTGILSGSIQATTLYLMKMDFTTDDGWLSPSKTTQSGVILEKMVKESYTFKNAATIFQIYIKLSNNKAVYHRSYTKLTDVLAKLNGLLSTIIVILGIMALPYARAKMLETVVNDVYKVRIEKGSKPNSSQKSAEPLGSTVEKDVIFIKEMQPQQSPNADKKSGTPSPQKSDSKKPINLDLTSSPVRQVRNSNLQTPKRDSEMCENSPSYSIHAGSPLALKANNEEDRLKDTDNCDRERHGHVKGSQAKKVSPIGLSASKSHETSQNINISYVEWLVSFVKPQPKVKLLWKGAEEVINSSDMTTIFKKIRDVDNIKRILLNPQQRVLFDNLAKPEIVFNADANLKDPNAVKVLNCVESYEGQQEKAQEVYEALIKVPQKSDLDNKILAMYEGNLENETM